MGHFNIHCKLKISLKSKYCNKMLKLIYPVNREVGKEEGDPFSTLRNWSNRLCPQDKLYKYLQYIYKYIQQSENKIKTWKYRIKTRKCKINQKQDKIRQHKVKTREYKLKTRKHKIKTRKYKIKTRIYKIKTRTRHILLHVLMNKMTKVEL